MTITALPTPPSRSAPSTFSALADAFLAALPTFVSEANALAVALNLASTNSTSVTSLAIGTGSKSLTVDVSKSYQPGMSVKIARTASPTNWMHGDVVSYDSGTGALVVSVSTVSGSGTYTDWTITLSGPAGVSAGRTNKTQADSPYSMTAANLNGLHIMTNTGASGEIINQLLAGADGYVFEGLVTAAQYLQFLCNGTETIRFKSTVSAAGGKIRSNVIGDMVRAKWNGTLWQVTDMIGSWKLDE